MNYLFNVQKYLSKYDYQDFLWTLYLITIVYLYAILWVTYYSAWVFRDYKLLILLFFLWFGALLWFYIKRLIYWSWFKSIIDFIHLIIIPLYIWLILIFWQWWMVSEHLEHISYIWIILWCLLLVYPIRLLMKSRFNPEFWSKISPIFLVYQICFIFLYIFLLFTNNLSYEFGSTVIEIKDILHPWTLIVLSITLITLHVHCKKLWSKFSWTLRWLMIITFSLMIYLNWIDIAHLYNAITMWQVSWIEAISNIPKWGGGYVYSYSIQWYMVNYYNNFILWKVIILTQWLYILLVYFKKIRIFIKDLFWNSS